MTFLSNCVNIKLHSKLLYHMDIIFIASQIVAGSLALALVAWVIFLSFRSAALSDIISPKKRVLLYACTFLFVGCSFVGVIALSGGYTFPYEYSFVIAGFALLIQIVYLISCWKKLREWNIKHVWYHPLLLLLAFSFAYLANFLEDTKMEYRVKNSEICTVVSIQEVTNTYTGTPIPSNDKDIPGDEMIEKKVYAVLRHERVYQVHVDSLSSERIVISENKTLPQTELVVHYETRHLIEKASAKKGHDVLLTRRLRAGDKVYLYKNKVLFP